MDADPEARERTWRAGRSPAPSAWPALAALDGGRRARALPGPAAGARAGREGAALALLGILNAGWYAIPQARLYAALPDSSATAIALGSASGVAAAFVPLGLGALAGAVGIAPTLWLLAVGPLALLALVPRRGTVT